MFGGCHHSSPTPTVIHHEKNAQSGPALRVRRISPTVDLLKDPKPEHVQIRLPKPLWYHPEQRQARKSHRLQHCSPFAMQ